MAAPKLFEDWRDRKIFELTERVEELEEELRQAKNPLGPQPLGVRTLLPFYPVHLTVQENRLLQELLKASPAPRQRDWLMEHISQKDTGNDKLIDVLVFRLRTKLKPVGGVILNHYSGLFSIPATSRDALRALEREHA